MRLRVFDNRVENSLEPQKWHAKKFYDTVQLNIYSDG